MLLLSKLFNPKRRSLDKSSTFVIDYHNVLCTLYSLSMCYSTNTVYTRKGPEAYIALNFCLILS